MTRVGTQGWMCACRMTPHVRLWGLFSTFEGIRFWTILGQDFQCWSAEVDSTKGKVETLNSNMAFDLLDLWCPVVARMVNGSRGSVHWSIMLADWSFMSCHPPVVDMISTCPTHPAAEQGSFRRSFGLYRKFVWWPVQCTG